MEEILKELEDYLIEYQLEYDYKWGAFPYINCNNDIELEGLIDIPIVIAENHLELGKQFIAEYFDNHEKQMLAFETHLLEKLSKFTNLELYNELLSSSNGDEWDGQFSIQQKKRFKLSQLEFKNRLTKIGFFA